MDGKTVCAEVLLLFSTLWENQGTMDPTLADGRINPTVKRVTVTVRTVTPAFLTVSSATVRLSAVNLPHGQHDRCRVPERREGGYTQGCVGGCIPGGCIPGIYQEGYTRRVHSLPYTRRST